MITKIDAIVDGPDIQLDNVAVPSVRLSGRGEAGQVDVDLSLPAVLELWDALGRYLEARVGF